MNLAINSVLLLSYALTTQAIQAGKGFEAFSGSFGPQLPVLYSRPTILWEVWSPSAHVTKSQIEIDGKDVDASYDDKRRAMFYTPHDPMRSGKHHIICKITFNGRESFRKEWDVEVSAVAMDHLPAATTDQKTILAIANGYREAQGLPDFLLDDRLNAAAGAHNQYLIRNDEMGHTEDSKKDGFVGKDGGARCEVYGWCGSSWEDVSFGETTAEFGVRNLFDAPYHRLPFMQPGNIGIGGDFDQMRITVEFGRSPAGGIEMSPADGEFNIPTTWWCHEHPSPLRFHTKEIKCGYPIVLAYFGNDTQTIDVAFEGLSEPDGTPVACWLNTPANDDQLSKASILIPESPLKPSTTYTVTASYRTGSELKTATWKFTTAAR